MVGVISTTTVWAPGTRPLPPRPWLGPGRRPERLQVDPKHPPKSVLALAQALPANAWQKRSWLEGSRGALTSRFAALRVRSAHKTERKTRVPSLEWLLIEWPEGESEPIHYWLSTLPAKTTVEELVRMTKLRWRIERDYQVLKNQIGLDHFEGRTWRGLTRIRNEPKTSALLVKTTGLQAPKPARPPSQIKQQPHTRKARSSRSDLPPFRAGKGLP